MWGVDSVPVAGGDSWSRLESPMVSVGKGDAVIQILPTALRFWEKLGLGPRGGKKDVTAFVLFECDVEERHQQLEGWLSALAATYAVSRPSVSRGAANS
jgi:mediator of RNA polymerase II transcription subunit 13